MSGIAIVLANSDFSSLNLGQVTPEEDVELESMSINGDSAINNEDNSATYAVAYTPSNTNQKGVTWSIESGGTYATINASTGVVTVLSGASSSQVVIKATSTQNNSITATKTITVTYQTVPTWYVKPSAADIEALLASADSVSESYPSLAATGTPYSAIIGQPINKMCFVLKAVPSESLKFDFYAVNSSTMAKSEVMNSKTILPQNLQVGLNVIDLTSTYTLPSGRYFMPQFYLASPSSYLPVLKSSSSNWSDLSAEGKGQTVTRYNNGDFDWSGFIGLGFGYQQ